MTDRETMMIVVKDIVKRMVVNEKIDCGLFDTGNVVSDPMETVFDNGSIRIDVCFPYNYFEIFGLSSEEFREIRKEYRTAGGGCCE